MNFDKKFRTAFKISSILAAVCLSGSLFIFLHSYYLTPYFTVKNTGDPRWRIFDFNSRQASEDEIYNVAERPAISKVSFSGNRRLRFEFTPEIPADSWQVMDATEGRLVHEGPYPEVQFPDTQISHDFVFIPKGFKPVKEMKIQLGFAPKESSYVKAKLSWPDNYWTFFSDIPFSLKKARSLDEWAGFTDDDPEIIEARNLLKGVVDESAPTLEKSSQIFLFIEKSIKELTGCPSDTLQAASPLETYKLMVLGKAVGWCENNALIYYLFANASGIKTRLVDRAGKFGPLKLTGHYFCESWIPEYAKWVYVDPMLFTAHVKNSKGVPVNTVELKHYMDLNAFSCLTFLCFDKDSGALVAIEGEKKFDRFKSGLRGNLVFAFKFGYGNNKSYSKLEDYLCHTTLLWAPFALPRYYLVKFGLLYGLMTGLGLMILSGIALLLIRKPTR